MITCPSPTLRSWAAQGQAVVRTMELVVIVGEVIMLHQLPSHLWIRRRMRKDNRTSGIIWKVMFSTGLMEVYV